jgi:hypothetical protein
VVLRIIVLGDEHALGRDRLLLQALVVIEERGYVESQPLTAGKANRKIVLQRRPGSDGAERCAAEIPGRVQAITFVGRVEAGKAGIPAVCLVVEVGLKPLILLFTDVAPARRIALPAAIALTQDAGETAAQRTVLAKGTADIGFAVAFIPDPLARR